MFAEPVELPVLTLKLPIASAAPIVFFPVAVNVLEGFRSTGDRQLDMLRAMGATRWQLFCMVKVPNAPPYIFVGLNIGAVIAILGAVVGGFVGAHEGLATDSAIQTISSRSRACLPF